MSQEPARIVNFEAARAEAFAERMLDALNAGALCLMTSIGHRTGLFDRMAELPPSTSDEIADAAGLDERYVREWLGAMVTARVVEYDSAAKRYRLPDEHAACLTRAATPDNVAAFAQYIPLLGQVEEGILECFESGGGLPYAAYPRFHEVMAEDSGQTVLGALFEHILPLEPGLTGELERGIDVLDVGCGSGRAINAMAARYPNSRFTGYDLCPDAVERARAEAARRGLTNVLFEVRDVTDLGERGSYDLITAFDAIHDQVAPAKVLDNIAAALRVDGLFLMQDIHASSKLENNLDHPAGTLMYTISTMHCMSVSLSGGGCGLGTMWGTELALKMLGEAGFPIVRVERLAHDFQNSYYLARKA
jgi:SAM-dependent methyltransferase